MSHGTRLDLEALLVHRDFVQRLSRALVHDRSLADDLAQETYLSAIRYAEQRSGRIESPRGLLGAIVWRLARRGGRRDRARTTREALADAARPESTPDEIAQRESVRRHVLETVLSLEEPYRRTVIARYLDDLDPATIAERDGVPVETVRTRLKRAQQRLRGALESEFGEARSYRGVLLALSGEGTRDAATIVFASTTSKIVVAAAAVALALLGVRLWSTDPNAPDPGSLVPVAASDTGDDTLATNDAETSVEPSAILEPATPATVARESVASDESLALTTWRGRIVDRKGKPIPGAEIRLVEPGVRVRAVTPERTIASVRSDADGRFELVGSTKNSDGDDKRSRYPRVLAEGYATMRFDTQRMSGLRQDDIVLLEATTLSGRVVDQEGRPVADSSVVVEASSTFVQSWRNEGPSEFVVVAATRSDPNGHFLLEGVPVDWVRVYADADQGRFFRSEPIPVALEDSTPPLELRVRILGDADRLVIDVRDADGGPIPAAKLNHQESYVVDESNAFSTIGEVVADETGRVTCFVLEGEQHRFELLVRGTVVATTPILERGAKPVTLVAPRIVESRIFVRDALGVVPTTVRVNLHDGSSNDPRGRELEREGDAWPFVAPAEAFRLTVKSVGFLTEELGPFEAGTIPPRLDVTLRSAGGVVGVVRDAKGPVADAWVRFEHRMGDGVTIDGIAVGFQPMSGTRRRPERSKEPVYDMAFTDAEGRYRIHPSFTRELVLRVDAAGYPPRTSEPFVLDPASPDVERDVLLEPGGAIEGRVTCADGGASAGLFVIAGRGHEEIYEAVVTEEGRYRLDDLPLGDYEVAVREVRDPVLTVTQGRVNVRDVRATVVSGGVARCDLEIGTRAKFRIEGRVTFSGTSRPERQVVIADRKDAIDLTGELRSVGLALWRGTIESEGRNDLGPRGDFAFEVPKCDAPRLVVRPGSSSNFFPGHYEFGIRLDEPVTSFVRDVPVGTIEVRIPETWKSLPNHAIALWRGENDDLALIGAESRENRVIRFVDVPTGRVRVQIGKFDQVVEVKKDETTIVDAP